MHKIHCTRIGVFIKLFEMGLILFADKNIFIIPKDTQYLSFGSVFLCLNRKKNIPPFIGTSAIVKNTMNLIYPTC